MQGRLERCTLRCFIARRITEFCMFQVERQTLSICLLLFRLGSGPSSFHKTDENSNSCHKVVEWEDYNLSRRDLHNGRVQGRVIDTKRYSHFSPPELGFCHELQKVCVRLMSCVGISGIGNKFSEYEGRTSQGEKVRKSLSEGVNRELTVKLTGRLSSTTMAVLPASLQYRGLQQQQITGLSMRGSYEDTIFTQGGKNGTELMDTESGSEQRTVHTVHCPTDGNPIQRFQVRLGSSVPRAIVGEPLVTRGRKEAYQPSRTESSSYG